MPLTSAVYNGHFVVFEKLLEFGMDVNGVSSGDGKQTRKTSLSWAVDQGNLDMIELLVKHGPDLEQPSMKWGEKDEAIGDCGPD